MIPIVDTLTGIAMAIVIVVGGGMVLGQELELGVMVAFLFYVQRFFDPIRSLTIQYSIMQRAMAAGQRIFEVLDVPIEVRDPPRAAPLPREACAIELDDVTFGYVPGRPVLRNVSLRVEPGETVALVGPTGSGKTSVTALVHRFYDVWSGTVHRRARRARRAPERPRRARGDGAAGALPVGTYMGARPDFENLRNAVFSLGCLFPLLGYRRSWGWLLGITPILSNSAANCCESLQTSTTSAEDRSGHSTGNAANPTAIARALARRVMARTGC